MGVVLEFVRCTQEQTQVDVGLGYGILIARLIDRW